MKGQEHWEEYFTHVYKDKIVAHSDTYVALQNCFYAGIARGMSEAQGVLADRCSDFVEESRWLQAGLSEPPRGPLS